MLTLFASLLLGYPVIGEVETVTEETAFYGCVDALPSDTLMDSWGREVGGGYGILFEDADEELYMCHVLPNGDIIGGWTHP